MSGTGIRVKISEKAAWRNITRKCGFLKAKFKERRGGENQDFCTVLYTINSIQDCLFLHPFLVDFSVGTERSLNRIQCGTNHFICALTVNLSDNHLNKGNLTLTLFPYVTRIPPKC